MADSNSPPPTPVASAGRRRASLAGQSLGDLFGRPVTATNQSNSGSNMTTSYPGPITSAAAQVQRRRLSLSTLGLSGSPTQQTSPFTYNRNRSESVSTANSASVDESPFEEGDSPPSSLPSNPTTPFARRMSFGARALREVRTNSGNGTVNGRTSNNFNTDTNKTTHPSTASPVARGEGFSFAENFRSRAERSSISGTAPLPSPVAPTAHQSLSKSATLPEPQVREVPKTPKVPDAFQERILKGDFYMD